jgi:hypothetical protein
MVEARHPEACRHEVVVVGVHQDNRVVGGVEGRSFRTMRRNLGIWVWEKMMGGRI